MTAARNAESVAAQPIPVALVKYFRAELRPVAQCYQCDWQQMGATLAEARIHVRHHPTHSVAIRRVATTAVWAEDRDGNVLTEDRHG